MPTATQNPPLLAPVTQEDLGALQLHLPALKVVSYRGPGESGGVSASLEPVVKQLGTKVHWIAVTGIPSSTVAPEAGFEFHRPELAESLLAAHSRVCHEYLWPLMHGMPEKARFDAGDWRSFRELSEIVAVESLHISPRSFPTLSWLHDYHMALVAPLIAMQTGNIPCHFWHVPWPRPEIILDSPVGREIVEALLYNKVLGFHTSEYATNFLTTVKSLGGNATVDLVKMEVRRGREVTKVVVMPLGLDFAYWQRLARSNKPKAQALPKKHRLANQFVLGVDRLEYSKGVMEKLLGLEAFLARHPDWHRRFHYVQLAQPPQTTGSEFESYANLVRAKAQELNSRYNLDGWEPVLWLPGYFEQADLSAWYQAADVLLVTPVRDGLNLIAKEYVASRQDEQGALVLSREAGSSWELSTGGLVVNPQNPDEIAEAVATALAMGPEEKRRRMHSMRHVVGWNQLHDWACGFLRQAI